MTSGIKLFGMNIVNEVRTIFNQNPFGFFQFVSCNLIVVKIIYPLLAYVNSYAAG